MPEKAPFYLGRDLPLKLGIISPEGLTDSCPDFFFLYSLPQTREIYLRKTLLLLAYSAAINLSWISTGYRIKIKFSFKASHYTDSSLIYSVVSTDI